jgi:predicted small integral membrane protein
MASRIGKVLLTAAMALYFSLVVWNNLADYSTNFEFVRHVLSMDTIGAASPLRARAVTRERLHHAFYGSIIGWEAATAILCWLGVIRLIRSLRAEPARFNRAKSTAVAGLVAGCALWLVAFLCIGGEWFLMWQSPTWNGQNAAFRMFAVTGLVLLFVHQPDPDP